MIESGEQALIDLTGRYVTVVSPTGKWINGHLTRVDPKHIWLRFQFYDLDMQVDFRRDLVQRIIAYPVPSSPDLGCDEKK